MAYLQKFKSIDAQMRLLVPKRVSEDDKLVDYGAFLLDRFLNILEDLHGKELRDTVQLRKPVFVEIFVSVVDSIECLDAFE